MLGDRQPPPHVGVVDVPLDLVPGLQHGPRQAPGDADPPEDRLVRGFRERVGPGDDRPGAAQVAPVALLHHREEPCPERRRPLGVRPGRVPPRGDERPHAAVGENECMLRVHRLGAVDDRALDRGRPQAADLGDVVSRQVPHVAHPPGNGPARKALLRGVHQRVIIDEPEPVQQRGRPVTEHRPRGRAAGDARDTGKREVLRLAPRGFVLVERIDEDPAGHLHEPGAHGMPDGVLPELTAEQHGREVLRADRHGHDHERADSGRTVRVARSPAVDRTDGSASCGAASRCVTSPVHLSRTCSEGGEDNRGGQRGEGRGGMGLVTHGALRGRAVVEFIGGTRASGANPARHSAHRSRSSSDAGAARAPLHRRSSAYARSFRPA